MRMARSVSVPWPGGIENFNPDSVRLSDRDVPGKALGALWIKLITLPDRGATASPGDVPPEFYRFPYP